MKTKVRTLIAGEKDLLLFDLLVPFKVQQVLATSTEAICKIVLHSNFDCRELWN